MELALSGQYYAHVPAVFWPILFVRLIRFSAWIKATGRQVQFTITRRGEIHARFVETHPNSYHNWLERTRELRLSHTLACQNASGQMHLPLYVQLVSAIIITLGCHARTIWVRIVLREVPDFYDTS